MNAKERHFRLVSRLQNAGFSYDEAETLRRIEMTLSRWAELECGDEHGRAIERDETTGKPHMTYDVGQNGMRVRYPIADRERGALKRLGRIMESHPEYIAYHQGDPRGCALYIVAKRDLEDNERDLPIESHYTRGIAVCS